jgi:hypothetical protein
MTLVAAGHGFVLVAGEEFLRLWIGEGRFIGYPVLVAIVAVYTLECAQFVLSSACRATDDESFTTPVVISAVAAPILILTLGRWLGVLAVPVGVLVAQTATVNWYAVWRTVTRMKLGWGAYARRVVVPWACVFGGMLVGAGGVVWVVRASLPSGAVRDVCVVFAAAVAGGLSLLVAHRRKLPLSRLAILVQSRSRSPR